ncbi:MAG: hypothetical protein RL095_2683 [Verrucomicrobiota bacterium]|jgi:CheY-like chemotaxis protein
MKAQRQPRILIVDDTPAQLRFLEVMLSRQGFDILTGSSWVDAERTLASSGLPDIVLMDVMMPLVDGLEACRRFKQIPGAAQIPLIFVTAVDSQEIVDKCFDAGGSDYVNKFATGRELGARIRTQLRLADSRQAETRVLEMVEAALDALPDALLALRRDGRLAFANAKARQCLSQPTADLDFLSAVPVDISLILGRDQFLESRGSGKPSGGRVNVQGRSYIISATPLNDAHCGETPLIFLSSRDVTEEERMERHLRQSQKMESLSRIAGSMAHELNNILGGLLGSLSLLRLGDSRSSESLITSAENSGRRASNVISQVLDFARNNDEQILAVPVDTVLRACLALLRNASGRSLLKVPEKPIEGSVLINPVNFQQILVNLVTAMAQAHPGQELSLIFSLSSATPHPAGPAMGILPGVHLRGQVRLAQAPESEEIFLKGHPSEAALGLGVMIAEGMVNDAGGQVFVEGGMNAPQSIGFQIPAQAERPAATNPTPEAPRLIIIQEPDANLRRVLEDMASMLPSCRFRLVNTPEQLMERLADHDQKYDVAIVDADGHPKLADNIMLIRFTRPEMKLVIGSSRDPEAAAALARREDIAFLEKPYRLREFQNLMVN